MYGTVPIYLPIVENGVKTRPYIQKASLFLIKYVDRYLISTYNLHIPVFIFIVGAVKEKQCPTSASQ